MSMVGNAAVKQDERVMLPPEMAEQFHNAKWGAGQLKSIAILKCFTDMELELLYGFGQIVSYKPKSYAVIESEPSRGLYIILHGTVSVYKNDGTSGNMIRLAFLDAGDSFGELSLFDSAPRSASVAAESVCHMFFLDAGLFNEFLNKVGPDGKIRFYRTCAEELVNRFRSLNGDYIASQQQLWKYALRKDSLEPSKNDKKEKKA